MYLDDLLKAGGRVYEVGGTVRDRLLNRTTKDIDLLVTGLPIETISKLLKPYGKIIFAGKAFGVLKFTPHDESGTTIDIAIPRKEFSTGTGHRDFKVDYDPSLSVEIDLGRRDFTVNAMALDLASGSLIDPYNGECDLKKKILRQVFSEAFIEDPLRLLRAVQFSARFNLEVEPATKESMTMHAALITTVSEERLIDELAKLLTAPKPSDGFRLMVETGILKHLLPQLDAIRGIKQAKQSGDDVFDHTMKVLDAARHDEAIDNSGNMNLMFAALLHDIGKSRTKRFSEKDQKVVFFGHQIVSARMANKFLKYFKASTIGVDTEIVCTLIENHMFETKSFYSEKAIRRFIRKIGQEHIYALIDLRIADNRGGKYPNGIKGVLKLKNKITEELNKKPPFGPSDLAVSGHDIMELGVPEGPAVGYVLKQLVESVLDDPSLNTTEHLIAIVKKIMDNGLPDDRRKRNR